MFEQTPISAKHHSIAAGGDVTIGISPGGMAAIIAAATGPLKRLTAAQRAEMAALKKSLDVSEEALLAFFAILGEKQVPPEALPARLSEIAGHYRDLRAQVAATPGDTPELARLKAAVEAALEAGRLDEADALLGRIEAEQDAALDRQRLDRAATAAQRGTIALTRLRYRAAAAHFAAAARHVPPDHEDQALAYLDQEADALYRQGEEFGDNAALAEALTRYRALLDRRPRERVPLDWAMPQNNLGNALLALGKRESGTERLEQAVAAYRAALEERTRERVPLDWAMIQNNLGSALAALGARESHPERLEEAVAAFRAALTERTRERVPVDWAMTRMNLGLERWSWFVRPPDRAVKVEAGTVSVFDQIKMGCCCCCGCRHVGNASALSKRSAMSTADSRSPRQTSMGVR